MSTLGIRGQEFDPTTMRELQRSVGPETRCRDVYISITCTPGFDGRGAVRKLEEVVSVDAVEDIKVSERPDEETEG
jgi:hypothetical protein